MIKAGIFDIGGVLMINPMDYVVEDIKETLGLNEEEFKRAWKSHQPKLNTGQITEDEFWRRFVKTSGTKKTLPKESLLMRQYIPHFEIDPEVLEIINLLKALGLKLAVLSNTVLSHTIFNDSQGIYDQFDVKVLSDSVGLAKPDPRIYQHTLSKLEVSPEESFFVDDMEVNVLAAQKLGIKGILFTDPESLKIELRKLGLKI